MPYIEFEKMMEFSALENLIPIPIRIRAFVSRDGEVENVRIFYQNGGQFDKNDYNVITQDEWDYLEQECLDHTREY